MRLRLLLMMIKVVCLRARERTSVGRARYQIDRYEIQIAEFHRLRVNDKLGEFGRDLRRRRVRRRRRGIRRGFEILYERIIGCGFFITTTDGSRQGNRRRELLYERRRRVGVVHRGRCDSGRLLTARLTSQQHGRVGRVARLFAFRLSVV